MKRTILSFLAIAGLVSCTSGKFDDYFPGSEISKDGDVYTAEAGGIVDGDYSGSEGGGEGSNHDYSGIVTAGEWNDLDNWAFWSSLMDGQTFGGYADTWGFYTSRRVPVLVVDPSENPVTGAKVELVSGEETLWTAVTDKFGRADLWAGLFSKEFEGEQFSVIINGAAQPGEVKAVGHDKTAEPELYKYTVTSSPAPSNFVDLAFIVDATGSMGDEIEFLKSDLEKIIGQVASMQTTCTFRTAALFYRDIGDEYITRYSNFSEDFDVTASFISKQRAAGGGDYPEAVHTALEDGIQKLSWSEASRVHLAFMLLDAPAHEDTQGEVNASLHKSMELYAAKGVKIIPVAASGVDKSTEFMCRFFSISTGGTYVFITNDSGVGGDHIEASVGEYEVEKLADLIVRLINKYI